MTSRNRETLRHYFSDGKLPTEKHFSDLIDSMLNMTDEGFSKTAEHGVEIFTPAGHDALISFFRDRNPNSRKSYLTFGVENERREQLLFQVGEDQDQGENESIKRTPVLTLDAILHDNEDGSAPNAQPTQRVGINQQNPSAELDVNGVLRTCGRIGGIEPENPDELVADGKWHDIKISSPLQGCQAFEIMAGVGLAQSGRFAMLHAIAMNTFNPSDSWFRSLFNGLWSRKKIRQTSAYYNRRCDQLELRWQGGSGRDAVYKLQIRSRCSYDDDPPRIQCQLTRLWFDPYMNNSVVKPKTKS
jgi:hypothetical protein